jgi:hypothetical protein
MGNIRDSFPGQPLRGTQNQVSGRLGRVVCRGGEECLGVSGKPEGCRRLGRPEA